MYQLQTRRQRLAFRHAVTHVRTRSFHRPPMTVQVAVNLWRSCGLTRSHSNQWFNWSFLLDTLMQHAWGIAFSYHLVFCPAPLCVQARLPQSTGGGRVLQSTFQWRVFRKLRFWAIGRGCDGHGFVPRRPVFPPRK